MRVISLLTFCLLGITMYAQDVVRLKDGTFFEGRITEYVSGEFVKLTTSTGALVTLKFNEVESVKILAQRPLLKTEGFFNNTSLGVMLGTDSWGDPNANFSASMVNGYMFGPHLQAGVGLGLEGIQGNLYFPTYADLRWNFRPRAFSPFIGLVGGYSFHNFKSGSTNLPEPGNDWWGNAREYDGGIMSGLYLGIRDLRGGELGYTISVGYRFQKLTEHYRDWEFIQPVKEVSHLNRVDLKFGIIF